MSAVRLANCNKGRLFLVVVLLFFTQGTASRVEQELYGRLVRGYNRQLRPVKRPNAPVRVQLDVALVEVLGLDETVSHITVKLWITMKWQDEYLKWDPGQYGGVRRMNFATGPDARIWTPDIDLLNGLRTQYVSTTDAVVTADGSVTWVRPVEYTVTSQHEFRGNSWSSLFRFASWTYDASLLDLQPLGGARMESRNSVEVPVVRMDTDNFAPSDHWALLSNVGRVEVTEYPCCPDEPYTSIVYVLKLRKKIGPSLLGRRGR